MSWISSDFLLDENRIRRLEGAGVRSLRDLAAVLAAVDLQAKISLETYTPPKPSGAKT